MNPELDVIAATLREHNWTPGEYRCSCGRFYARTLQEHQAEEVELDLRNAGFGIFLFERLGLLEEDL